MQPFRYIIWDLDGTLTYTLEDLMLSVNHALRSCGMPERTLEQIRQSVGNGVRQLVLLSVPGGESNPLFEECFSTFVTHYTQHCQDHTRLYDGVDEALRQLHAAGIRMAIVSNKLQAGVDELYARWFADTIEVAIGEREGMARKPQPDMVHLAMHQLGAAADNTVYIGDSEVDLATAKNAGLPCISVLWGFRDRDLLLAHGATTLVQTPDEIQKMLLP